MLRDLKIGKLLYEVLRPNYSLLNEYKDDQGVLHPVNLNKFYTFLLCLLYPLKFIWADYDYYRRRMYAIADCSGQRGQMIAILNYYYGARVGYGPIYLTPSNIAGDVTYLYTDTTPIVYFYDSPTPVVYLYPPQAAGGQAFQINVPQILADSSEYSDFIADLNTMTLYSIILTINIY